jgi:telomere length regulation protein
MDPSFIQSIGHYIGSADPAIRRCGMLAAEIVAAKAGKKLDFGGWDDDEPGKAWARELRALIQARDVDVNVIQDPAEVDESTEPVKIESPAYRPTVADLEGDSDDEDLPPPKTKHRPAAVDDTAGYDSDDSLTGYASPSSSRSPSPTPSELDQIERDPSLNVGVKKIPRPVYLAQLGQLLRPTTISKADEAVEADRIEMGLQCAEELICRKRDYGTELEENAVNLVHGIVGLSNNFDIKGFNERRQDALTALVACCPTRAAPSVVEEFFKNQYSMDQRFVMLNALAFGARELAGLPVPPSTVDPGRIAFPSKRLPPGMEKKYITATDHANAVAGAPVQGLLQDISRDVVANSKEPSGPEPAQLARERQLRIRQPAKVVPLPPPSGSTTLFRPQAPVQKPRTSFTTVAAEYFIHPLVSRFWLFLRDEQTREERTSYLPELHRYRAAGTGLLLSPAILAQFVATLGVLMHAARNAPVWGAVLAPEALELAVTLGARKISMLDEEEDQKGGTERGEGGAGGTHASVMSAALELALVVLDGSIDLDRGKTLGLEHTALLVGVGEWAAKVFAALDRGERVKGGGGEQEVRLVRAAAGVCLKVEEMTKTWGRSMVQM